MNKVWLWIGAGVLALAIFILIAAWPSESTDWCNSESGAGDCRFEQGDHVCYCIDTFPKESEIESLNMSMLNAAKLRCQRRKGALAAIEHDTIVQSLSKRMYEMGVDKALVALRKIEQGWFWLKEDGKEVEYGGIIWRFPPHPEHKQAMINVETVKTPADPYEYNWNYYNYDHYVENDRGYVWYGFSTCNDIVDKNAYYICQYNTDSQLKQTSDKQDACFCPGNTKITLHGVDQSAIFTTPGFPKNYCSDNYCRWSITVPLGLAIQIDFLVFSLEKDMDFVYIYEGLDPDSPLLQKCTAVKCTDLRTAGHKLQVLFHADHITTDLGFRAMVVAVETDICYCSASKSIDLINHLDSYTLVSPGYPKPYCPSHNCGWTVTVEKPLVLMMSFNEFDLGSGDFLSFFKDGNILLNSCTDATKCDIVLTEVTELTIHFNSSTAQGTHTGFQASVTALRNYCERFEEGVGYTIAYSKERHDRNIPPGDNATVTCANNYKISGSIDKMSLVIICQWPMAMWERDQLCVEVCEVPEESAAQDLDNMHLCDKRLEPQDMIHNITVQHHNFNQKASQLENFTCVGQTWTPADPICHHMHDFKILIIGGVHADSGKTIEVYHPKQPEKNRLLSTELTEHREGAVSVRLSDGSVLIAGGSTNYQIKVHSSCELFWPNSLSITKCPSLNQARVYAAGTLLDNILYICGGNDFKFNRLVLESCELFSKDLSWEPLTANMSSKRVHLALVALDGFVYAIGGERQDGYPLDTVESYRPTHGQWAAVASMNLKRSTVQGTSLWGKIFVCSNSGIHHSSNPSNGKYVSDCEAYDPAKNTWSFIPQLTKAYGFYYSYPLVALDALYVLGGAGTHFTYDNVMKFERKEDKWVDQTSLIKQRQYSSVVVIP